MNGLLADVKHALRVYRRTPVASVLAAAVLAIGMAFVGAFLSLYVDLVRPHPGFHSGGEVVSIRFNTGGAIRVSLLERIAAEITTLEAVAGVDKRTFDIGTPREPREVELVTSGFFGGVRPRLALGRGFEATDHLVDAAPVAVISDEYWREQFNRSADALGRIVDIAASSSNIGDEPTAFRIVGVMAPEMKGTSSSGIAVWLPLERAAALLYPLEQIEANRRAMQFPTVVGRRATSAAVAAVAVELNARFGDFDEYRLPPGSRFEAIAGIVQIQNFEEQRDAVRQLQLFLGGSILLALVAAANTSLFLLARAPGRRRELGIRTAVGAPRARLTRQLATEAALLVLVATALGLAASVWLSEFLRSLSFFRGVEWNDVTPLHWRVLTLVAGFFASVTLAVSLAPILGLKRLCIAASSRQVAARATFAQRLAGTAQIAAAAVFGAVGAAFAWHLGSLMLVHPGYETDDIYIATFTRTMGMMTNAMTSLSLAENERLREAMEALPGVDGVAFGAPAPSAVLLGSPGLGVRTVRDAKDPTREIEMTTGAIDSRFIELLSLEMLHGRAPVEHELGVAVVNRIAARQYFGRDNVVGEVLPIEGPDGPQSVIVGVIEDFSTTWPTAQAEPLVYLTSSRGGLGTLIRSSRPAAELQKDVQGLIDSGVLEVSSVRLTNLATLRSSLIAPDRARGLLTIAATSLVVLLAAFGFYGMQRYLVAAGRREYAIRAALGASPASLGRLVLWRGLILSLPGLILGGLLAFIVVAWQRGDFLPHEMSASAVTAAVMLGLAVLLLIASLGPARDARRTQPAALLKED